MEDLIWNCIIKRLTDTETMESKLVLEEWLGRDPIHVKQFQEAEALWMLTAQVKEAKPLVSFEEVLLLHQHEHQKKPLKRYLSPLFYRVAASLVILLFAGLLFRQYNSTTKAPAVPEWVVEKAAYGEVKLVTMPDQSKIWLNAGTSIKYLKSFNLENTRLVVLNGEAYFDVKHDSSHPFVVESAKLRTTVYGTSFNIRSYSNEHATSVIVNSGKVGVIPMEGKAAATFLYPQDKLVYQHGRIIKSIEADQADNWIEGDVVFDQTPLLEVFETISRKYKVTIDAGESHYEDCKLSARFRNQPLSVVLKTLKLSMNINSNQSGNTIYLKGGTSCKTATK